MSAAATEGPAEAEALPLLRADLDCSLVSGDRQTFPAAIVSDPVRGGYYRLEWPESGIFLAWQRSRSVSELREAIRREFGAAADRDAVAKVVEFGLANQLTQSDQDGGWHRLASLHGARKRSLFSSAMHNYLFFRIPLVHPDVWLKRLLPWLSFPFSRPFWCLVAAIAGLGCYLAFRQWSALASAAMDVVRMEMLAIYGVVLLLLKCVHELGHALTTVRYGCRVPSMGVAFMLGVPVLYTDTSDSWRLARRSERLAIVFAGVAAEMIVAVVAITAWCFLPDGFLRTTCFALSTASVVMSLAVNLNPCMRFDGYFALADYLGVPNLQARSFDLWLWRLREWLFDLGRPPPEVLPLPLQRTLIRYALLTAIYRFFLFIGIAATVYVVAGKAIGIVLGLFEIAVFIAAPVIRELATWWTLRREIMQRRRFRWTFGTAVLGLAVLAAPWVSTVEVPAVLMARNEGPLHLPFPAKLRQILVSEGQRVRAGEALFVADAEDLERDRRRARLEERALAVQVARLTSSEKEREHRLVLESRLSRAREEIAAIERRRDQLVVRAPFDGIVVDIDPAISEGIWLNEKEPLARLVSEGETRARGMIEEKDIARVAAGASAVFVPDDAGQTSVRLVVEEIAPASNGRFSEPVLADRYGGPVAAGEAKEELVTRHGFFEVTFAPFVRPAHQVVRGIARIDAVRTSPLSLLWSRIARVLVREQGF